MYSIYSVLQSIPYTCDNASFHRLVVSDRHCLKKTHQHHRCHSRPEMHLDFETAAGSLLTLASIGSGAQNEKVLEFTPLKSWGLEAENDDSQKGISSKSSFFRFHVIEKTRKGFSQFEMSVVELSKMRFVEGKYHEISLCLIFPWCFHDMILQCCACWMLLLLSGWMLVEQLKWGLLMLWVLRPTWLGICTKVPLPVSQ